MREFPYHTIQEWAEAGRPASNKQDAEYVRFLQNKIGNKDPYSRQKWLDGDWDTGPDPISEAYRQQCKADASRHDELHEYDARNAPSYRGAWEPTATYGDPPVPAPWPPSAFTPFRR